MKRRRAACISFIMLLALLLGGCGTRVPSDAGKMERLNEDTDKNIRLVIVSLDNDNCTAELSVVNESGRGISFGEDYYIQQKRGSSWKEVKRKTDTVAWNAVAFVAESKGDCKWTVHWKLTYGVLEKGQYRIVKPYPAGNNQNAYCICEFTVGD